MLLHTTTKVPTEYMLLLRSQCNEICVHCSNRASRRCDYGRAVPPLNRSRCGHLLGRLVHRKYAADARVVQVEANLAGRCSDMLSTTLRCRVLRRRECANPRAQAEWMHASLAGFVLLPVSTGCRLFGTMPPLSHVSPARPSLKLAVDDQALKLLAVHSRKLTRSEEAACLHFGDQRLELIHQHYWNALFNKN